MNKKIRWLKQIAGVGLFAAALAISGAGNAQNLVQNGEFNVAPSALSTSYCNLGNCQFTSSPLFTPPSSFDVTDWTLGSPYYLPPSGVLQQSLAFDYTPAGADMNGAPAPGNSQTPFYLWGPTNPGGSGPGVLPPTLSNCYTPSKPSNCFSNNTLPTAGSNYLASDADPFFSGAITDTLKSPGLAPNTTYDLSFDYATAEFRNYNGNAWPILTPTGMVPPTTIMSACRCPRPGRAGWRRQGGRGKS